MIKEYIPHHCLMVFNSFEVHILFYITDLCLESLLYSSETFTKENDACICSEFVSKEKKKNLQKSDDIKRNTRYVRYNCIIF